MNELPRQKLRELIARYGPSLSDDPRRTEGLLRDFCGEYKREIFVLVSALREQVAADLLTLQDSVPHEMLLAQLTRRLQDNLALTEDAARWAVESWALALGVIEQPLPSPPPRSEGEPARVAAPASSRRGLSPDRSPAIRGAPLLQAVPTEAELAAIDSGLLYTWKGHTGWVHSVAFSPDGCLLASGSEDGTVRLWDVASAREGRCQVLGKGPGFSSAPVYSVAFGLDGRTLAWGGGDGKVHLRDVARGQGVRRLEGRAGEVSSVAFSPGGRLLASASLDTVVLWDVAQGQEERQLKGHTHLVQSVVFSPDGRTLASVGGDRTVRLWDVASGRQVRQLRGHTGPVWSAAFSPDGRTLASGGRDKTVRLWDVARGLNVRRLEGHVGEVNSVAFSPDGRLLASASLDTVVLWDVVRGQEDRQLKGHTHLVQSVAFSPDGRVLASGSWDETVRLWRVE